MSTQMIGFFFQTTGHKMSGKPLTMVLILWPQFAVKPYFIAQVC